MQDGSDEPRDFVKEIKNHPERFVSVDVGYKMCPLHPRRKIIGYATRKKPLFGTPVCKKCANNMEKSGKFKIEYGEDRR